MNDLTGKAYEAGSYPPCGAAIPVEKNTTFTSVILITRSFFTQGNDLLQRQLLQRSTLVEELYHCALYELAWQRRGYIYPKEDDVYTSALFVTCSTLHDEYAVARLKCDYFANNPQLQGVMGNLFLGFPSMALRSVVLLM